ncbi:MAG: SH3 domain-containing protein [Pseudomonadota bacterium]
MFRLIAVTLAALYVILNVYGDADLRPDDVARSNTPGLHFATAPTLAEGEPRAPVLITTLSESEAIDRAIAEGRAVRDGRHRSSTPAPKEEVRQTATAAQPTAEVIDYWYVTGSRVNLRGGPSTSNAVVGQVTQGMEAEVLSDRDGWYEIRLADGSGTGWIFGSFLEGPRPG